MAESLRDWALGVYESLVKWYADLVDWFNKLVEAITGIMGSDEPAHTEDN